MLWSHLAVWRASRSLLLTTPRSTMGTKYTGQMVLRWGLTEFVVLKCVFISRRQKKVLFLVVWELISICHAKGWGCNIVPSCLFYTTLPSASPTLPVWQEWDINAATSYFAALNNLKQWSSGSCSCQLSSLQIIPPHDVNISHHISANLTPWSTSWDTTIVKQQSSQIVDPLATVIKGYFNEIQQFCYRREENASLGLKFTFTPMHGVGGDAVKRAFKAFNLPEFVPVPEQVSHWWICLYLERGGMGTLLQWNPA